MSRGNPQVARLRVDRIQKYRASFRVLNEVSFSLYPGEVVGLIGPNGAGKTTLMRILAGLSTASSGSATIDGHPVGTTTARRAISFMPEEPDLYPGLSVSEHVRLLDRLNQVPADQRTSINADLARYGLEAQGDKLPHELSQGMKQKLALILALRKGADLFLFDEPSNGLDPQSSRELRQQIRALAEQGFTVLVSTHGLTELQEIADRVMILYAGKITHTSDIAAGPTANVHSLEDTYLSIIGAENDRPKP